MKGLTAPSAQTQVEQSAILSRSELMPVDIEEAIEKAFEQAFLRALEQVLQDKAETLFKKAFADGSPLAVKLEQKIEQGIDRFFQEGARWEKKKPGFKR